MKNVESRTIICGDSKRKQTSTEHGSHRSVDGGFLDDIAWPCKTVIINDNN